MNNLDTLQEWKLREMNLDQLVAYYRALDFAVPCRIRSVQGAINRIKAAYDATRKKTVTHKSWTISYAPKPVPLRMHDWDAVHQDYDGPEDWRALTGASVQDCIEQIDEAQA